MDLVSREFSTATLEIAVDLVQQHVGMDNLEDKTNEELQEELALLEQACTNMSCLFTTCYIYNVVPCIVCWDSVFVLGEGCRRLQGERTRLCAYPYTCPCTSIFRS